MSIPPQQSNTLIAINIGAPDWLQLADDLLQAEPLLTSPIEDWLIHIAGLTRLAQLALVDRQQSIRAALAAGATFTEVQQAIGLGASTEAPQIDAAALAIRAPRQRLAECRDCGHEFDPDTSPELDRCWMCSERLAEVIG